jgi:hypothetical protein
MLKNMRNLFIILIVLITTSLSKAQVSDGKLTIEKVDQPAVVGTFSFSPDITTAVLQDDMKYRGFGKGDEKRGLYKYTGILFTDISNDKIDFYFKVEQGDKKNENTSTVYILVSKGYDNFISRANGSDIYKATVKYLEGLMAKFEEKKLALDIENQEKIVKDAEKKYNNAVDDGKDLADKKQKIEQQILENTKTQEESKAGLDKEKELLETLNKKKK